MPVSNSAIYTGTIRHRRFAPSTHDFSYPIFMLYLDLDEIEELFSKKWYTSLESLNFVSFRRKDFFEPDKTSLKLSVIESVKQELGEKLEIKSVRMLCHIRYGNYVFNPVVFYYCFDADDQLLAILAEITNTPWGERHHYVLPVTDNALGSSVRHSIKGLGRHQFEFSKEFHVSPFNPMNMEYRWVFSNPEKSLRVHMENFLSQEGHALSDSPKHFDATLVLTRHCIEKKLAKTLIQYPFVTVKVVSGIYWQAFKLWCKRMPFYDHPSA